MLTLQVYRADPSGIGFRLSRATTIARIAVHAAPLHPGGSKANAVPPLLMLGFTEQSGLPLISAAIGVFVLSKAMSFCTPTMDWPIVFRVTPNTTVVPGSPSTDPIAIPTPVGGAGGELDNRPVAARDARDEW